MGWEGNYDVDTIDEFASLFAGNWKDFEDFVWHDEPDDYSSDWGIFYTKSEGIPDTVHTVNHDCIAARLNQYYNVDVIEQCDRHWAFGIQHGFAVRVYNLDRSYTAAFLKLYDIFSALKNYPVLDEERLSELENDEMLDAWEEWGRDDFRDTLNHARFFLDDAALSQVSMDFSYLSDAVIDELVFYHGLTEYWEHAGNRILFNCDSIVDRINGMGVDWIIDTCFADLDSYSVADSKTGSLFPSV